MKENSKDLPFYVIEIDSKVIGFGLLQHYHRVKAFKHAATITYFILLAHTEKGLGKKLLNVLTKEAKKLGIDTLLAHISSKNKPSLNFHKKNGFKQCGRFRRIGKKFGEYFDVVWMQKFI